MNKDEKNFNNDSSFSTKTQDALTILVSILVLSLEIWLLSKIF